MARTKANPQVRANGKEIDRESKFYPGHYMSTTEYKFWTWLKKNLKLYRRIIVVAREVKAQTQQVYGINTPLVWGIDGLCAVARLRFIHERQPQMWQMTNTYRPFLARFIMRTHPDLAGLFNVKEQFAHKGTKIPKAKSRVVKRQPDVAWEPTAKDERIITKLEAADIADLFKTRG